MKSKLVKRSGIVPLEVIKGTEFPPLPKGYFAIVFVPSPPNKLQWRIPLK